MFSYQGGGPRGESAGRAEGTTSREPRRRGLASPPGGRGAQGRRRGLRVGAMRGGRTGV